jgi:lipopolysaccharide export system ATP-binding protein
MEGSVLEVSGIAKKIGSKTIVSKVDFKLQTGEVLGLLGPNGAGKTTTFYMVVGLLSPDKGKIQLDEHDISRFPLYKRARLGISYLPQEPSVFRKLTVADNILSVLEMTDLPRQDQEKRLEDLLLQFGLQAIRNSYGIQLSGGERRRVEIARAVALRPKFLLLDEPFAGIDPLAVIDLQNMINQLKQQGIGILITDHNVRETLGICDYALILQEGKIGVKGKPSEIADDPRAKEVYLGENFRL